MPALRSPPDSIAQRDQLERDLRAAGAVARKEAAELRARTGKTALPPPPEPPMPVMAPERTGRPATAALVPPNLEAAIALDRVRTESDDASLNSFLRQLVRRQPDRPGPRALAVAAGTAEPPAAAADEQPARRPSRRADAPETPILDRMLTGIGVLPAFGPGEAVAAPSAAAPASALGDVATATAVRGGGGQRLTIGFSAGLTGIADPGTADLARLAGQARASGERVLVVGHGDTQDLALARARAVAQALIRHGLPAQAVSMRSGGAGDAVLLVTDAATS